MHDRRRHELESGLVSAITSGLAVFLIIPTVLSRDYHFGSLYFHKPWLNSIGRSR